MVLEVLYAASLTILLVRLKYRFGATASTAYRLKELAAPLKTYVARTSGCTGVSPDSGHSAAVIFVRFAEGNYGEAARESGTAAGRLEEAGTSSCLTRAFKIVREHAALLDKALPRPQVYLTFSPEDADLLAKPVSGSPEKDHEFYATLDNALLLLFSAAWNTSEKDRTHLLACEAFAQKLFMQ
jgi:hypothetical protein